jgi:hypothetical protein
MVTSFPSSINRVVRYVPTKPVPPVIRILIDALLLSDKKGPTPSDSSTSLVAQSAIIYHASMTVSRNCRYPQTDDRFLMLAVAI